MSFVPTLSVVVTSRDEGSELLRTLGSLHRTCRSGTRFLVVDDGSDAPVETPPEIASVLRSPEPIGVAASRHRAVHMTSSDVVAFADAHQRFSPDCYAAPIAMAIERQAIVSPTLQGFGWWSRRLYGAAFQLCPEQGYFSARWIVAKPLVDVVEHTSLKGPGYCIPRELYPRLAWSPLLRGWGASEAWISLKAFFQRIPILYIRGPIAYHRFRRKFPYAVTWDGIWRNHALLARVCFDDRTWGRHWLPNLFAAHLSSDVIAEMDSPAVMAEHDAFQPLKTRTDREFWEVLLGQSPPRELD